jgi:hypothetical protein
MQSLNLSKDISAASRRLSSDSKVSMSSLTKLTKTATGKSLSIIVTSCHHGPPQRSLSCLMRNGIIRKPTKSCPSGPSMSDVKGTEVKEKEGTPKCYRPVHHKIEYSMVTCQDSQDRELRQKLRENSVVRKSGFYQNYSPTDFHTAIQERDQILFHLHKRE